MKRLVSAMVMIAAVSTAAQAKYSGGSGTAGDPYQIGTAADLLALATDTADYGKHFILATDIDLASYSFTAAVIAPAAGETFGGVFDGAGHKITNLTVDTNGADKSKLGLFGSLYIGGEIKNLGLENVTVTAVVGYSSYLGGLVGVNYLGTIRNCHSTGAVTGGDNSSYVGGLVGHNDGGTISNCFSAVAVTGGNYLRYIGGLVGGNNGDIGDSYSTGGVTGGGGYAGFNGPWYLGGLVGANGTYATITNCYSTGSVRGGVYLSYVGGLVGANGGNLSTCYSAGTVIGGTSSSCLGGLVGGNGDCSYGGTGPGGGSISDCYSTGDVYSGDSSTYVGGAAGRNYGKPAAFSTISSCYSTGSVRCGSGTDRRGGLLGYNEYGTVSNCYFLVTGGLANGWGTPLTDAQMKQQSSFVGWDFVGETANGTADIWSISQGVDYPTFARESDGEGAESLIEIAKCTVTAGSTDTSDSISFSGTMNATADDFGGASVIEVTVDSDDVVNPCVQTFAIDGRTFKKGKYSYSGTVSGVKKSFKYNGKTYRFSLMGKNLDLSGLGCPVTIEIKIGDYVGTAQVDEAIVNGPRRPIPIKLMMGVKNSLRVDKVLVKRGANPNSDQLTAQGGFAVDDINVNLVDEELVVTLGTQTFTLPAGSFKAGKDKWTCPKAQLTEGGVVSATFNLKTCSFTIKVKNIEVAANPGAVDFGLTFADFSEMVQTVLP